LFIFIFYNKYCENKWEILLVYLNCQSFYLFAFTNVKHILNTLWSEMLQYKKKYPILNKFIKEFITVPPISFREYLKSQNLPESCFSNWQYSILSDLKMEDGFSLLRFCFPTWKFTYVAVTVPPYFMNNH